MTSFYKYLQKNSRFLLIVVLFVTVNSCNKSIETTEFDAYTPSSLDENGGNWKTYVLITPADVTVAAPKATSSPEYQAEIAELKSLQTALTDDQKSAVKYWSAGAVLRWHEIAREMAARYNLPPVYDPVSNTYPLPSSANPAGPPRFPFANPPYAARAFAYLAVAQYDALVAAWNYKYQYKRLAPSKNDNTVKPLISVTDLPSYPSEDAVVAAASVEMLKRLFPLEADFLAKKLQEHKDSRLWAGTNVRSDVDAGDALGKAVAAKIVTRFASDGMATAGSQAQVAAMIANAKSMGLTEEWKSQETPARPGMLPGYVNVKTWNFDDATKVALRPLPPPAIGSAEFNKNMDELRGYAKKLTREQQRIAAYWSDGVGSYTPPGHWNRTAAELAYQYKYNELRFARTMALTCTAVQDAGVCCWDTKYYYFYPRPNQLDKSIKSTIGLPNFPSYTSGHSTFSGAAATILSHLFPAEAQDLNARAAEASISRIYGCIHYRFDCEAGLKCGNNIGAYAVQRAKADGAN
jgi:hypothetical protein